MAQHQLNMANSSDEKVNGFEIVVKIIQRMDEEIREKILWKIKEKDSEIGRKIEDNIVFYKDIINLKNNELLALVKSLPVSDLPVLINNLPKEKKETILNLVPSHKKGEFVESMINIGRKTNIEDYKEKQKRILETFEDLKNRGEIRITRKILLA